MILLKDVSIAQELIARARVVLPITDYGHWYFTYHTIQGDKGIHTYFKLKSRLLAAQTASRNPLIKNKLELKVKGLRHTSLDLDLLEERAGVALNLMRDDDLLIYFPR